MGSYKKQVIQKQDNNDAYDKHGKQSDMKVICQIRSDQEGVYIWNVVKKDKQSICIHLECNQ
jgi:hypothetical protein